MQHKNSARAIFLGYMHTKKKPPRLCASWRCRRLLSCARLFWRSVQVDPPLIDRTNSDIGMPISELVRRLAVRPVIHALLALTLSAMARRIVRNSGGVPMRCALSFPPPLNANSPARLHFFMPYLSMAHWGNTGSLLPQRSSGRSVAPKAYSSVGFLA